MLPGLGREAASQWEDLWEEIERQTLYLGTDFWIHLFVLRHGMQSHGIGAHCSGRHVVVVSCEAPWLGQERFVWTIRFGESSKCRQIVTRLRGPGYLVRI